ncbi:subtilisin-like protease SBT1.8 [Canna indica]|uniref:Subtilisin-like protease SBT1.8 n=1 Tax=Canna indica TaxID=4628 RepID=A0AAQ3JYA8_9LILI|nr:subtilisin-like protease SBT1.8 [Canna indica]
MSHESTETASVGCEVLQICEAMRTECKCADSRIDESKKTEVKSQPRKTIQKMKKKAFVKVDSSRSSSRRISFKWETSCSLNSSLMHSPLDSTSGHHHMSRLSINSQSSKFSSNMLRSTEDQDYIRSGQWITTDSEFLLFLVFFACVGDLVSCNRTYIVHMNPDCRPLVHPTHVDWYAAHLQSMSIGPWRHLLYTYSDIFHGFATALLPHHLPLLHSSYDVLNLYPDPVYELHTTRSPQFLDFALNADSASSATALPRPIQVVEAASHDVFIVVLDIGVWPKILSFSDVGLPEVPSRWRGACEAGVDFSLSLCNRKLVAARRFAKGFHATAVTTGDGSVLGKPKEYDSTWDQDGHETHTTSTTAGFAMANASLLEYAAGTALDMAIDARVAAYKVCGGIWMFRV